MIEVYMFEIYIFCSVFNVVAIMSYCVYRCVKVIGDNEIPTCVYWCLIFCLICFGLGPLATVSAIFIGLIFGLMHLSLVLIFQLKGK